MVKVEKTTIKPQDDKLNLNFVKYILAMKAFFYKLLFY